MTNQSVNRLKDRAIKIMVDFISHPEKFGCEIKPSNKCGNARTSSARLCGLVFLGRKALAQISVGEVIDHATLGVVSVRSIDTRKRTARVHDANKEHVVKLTDCKRILI